MRLPRARPTGGVTSGSWSMLLGLRYRRLPCSGSADSDDAEAAPQSMRRRYRTDCARAWGLEIWPGTFHSKEVSMSPLLLILILVLLFGGGGGYYAYGPYGGIGIGGIVLIILLVLALTGRL